MTRQTVPMSSEFPGISSEKIPPTGVEPVACALGKRRSILLSYEGVVVSIFNSG